MRTRVYRHSSRAHTWSFILRSAQQEEALHRIWYALKNISSLFWRVLDELELRLTTSL
ncbi:unnamed protein product [Spirodela intermedia]|uniref:Uncharacterized protein n=1 Tax=Spirodela intermedia TaxID=51605 RepID=A0A7I8KV76_SPIIN|nr:unnamed protein product [Spirodela intermedia]